MKRSRPSACLYGENTRREASSAVRKWPRRKCDPRIGSYAIFFCGTAESYGVFRRVFIANNWIPSRQCWWILFAGAQAMQGRGTGRAMLEVRSRVWLVEYLNLCTLFLMHSIFSRFLLLQFCNSLHCPRGTILSNFCGRYKMIESIDIEMYVLLLVVHCFVQVDRLPRALG